MTLFYKLLIILSIFVVSNLPFKNHAKTIEPILVSIKTSKANLRFGPGKNYPIKVIFIKKNIPLLIIDRFDHWRKVITNKNQIGWIHKSQLSTKYKSIVLNPDYLRKKPKLSSKKIALLGKNVNVSIIKCKFYWCKINLKDRKYSGWYIKEYLWGANYIIIK